MTDPISDLLARIKNALKARHEFLSVPYSSMKMGIVKILAAEGFLGVCRESKDEKEGRKIQISLRYVGESREPVFSSLVRRSRPGRRVYVGYRGLKAVRSGIGVAILSTPKGILTDRQAREQKLGGEVLLTVW